MIIRSSKNAANDKRQLVQLFFYFILVVVSAASVGQLIDSDRVIDYQISYDNQNFFEDDNGSDSTDEALLTLMLSVFIGFGLTVFPSFTLVSKTSVVKNYVIRAPPLFYR